MVNIRGLFLSFLSALISHVLPARCPLSGEVVETQGMLSPKSWQSLNFVSDPFCDCCGLPLEVSVKDAGALLCGSCTAEPKPYNKARSSVVYDDASRELILAFKHGDQTHLTLTFIPWLKVTGADFLKDCDLIVPVPLHWRRLLKRRYNQSALIARLLARETNLSYDPEALKRVRHTPVQGHLSARKRHDNVKHAFALNKKYEQKIRNKKIILIDDVFTTGATVEECSKILYAAGAERVDVLTVARVSKPDSMD